MYNGHFIRYTLVVFFAAVLRVVSSSAEKSSVQIQRP